MASFELAYALTAFEEGGYANHPADRGGETWRGIARRHHPAWGGWTLIDYYRGGREFPAVLDRDATLVSMVRSFYRDEFWVRVQGDGVQAQAVADELFDTAVNLGVRRAGVFLQVALNALNRRQVLYPNLHVDGKIGQATLLCLAKYQSTDTTGPLLKLLNIQQGQHYLEQTLLDETQEAFLRGWLRRVSLAAETGSKVIRLDAHRAALIEAA